MSLRFKLLLIALSTLILPWAGWQFIRQMEQLLREGQEQALIASTKTLERSLVALKTPLPSTEPALYVHESSIPITVDGYSDDWALLIPYEQNLGSSNNIHKVQVLFASYEEWLYAVIEVHDRTRMRVDADDPRLPINDHLVFVIEQKGAQQRYKIANAAPGRFEASALNPVFGSQFPFILTGQWQETSSGYRIEFRLPLNPLPSKIGIYAHDDIYEKNNQNDIKEPEIGLYSVLKISPQIEKDISQLAPENTRVRFLSNEGWVIANIGKLSLTDIDYPSHRRWWENWIYRRLIAPGLTNARDFSPALPRLSSPEIWQALTGIASTAWYPSESQENIVLATAIPIFHQGEIRGILLLEQSSNALPLLTNRALWELMGASLLAIVIAGIILFLFAGVLSVRIRRLRNAAERALQADGRMNVQLPMTSARDELGDLSRSFAKLLSEINEYTEYLRTITSKLSHELQTPLAIVKSSLDNLDQQAIPVAAQPYVTRARDGAERLGAIVRAMSEASRMERAIASAEGEDFDLCAVVQGCAEAYRALFAPRELLCEMPEEPKFIYGAPELVAQALDKLFDNAQSFTPSNGWIRIHLMPTADGVEIRVANSGAPLPDTMQERLFDSLVSMREQRTTSRSRSEAPHLGLGLYVVRLIAELHQGKTSARNLQDDQGVEFCLVLRGMPRQRLGK